MIITSSTTSTFFVCVCSYEEKCINVPQFLVIAKAILHFPITSLNEWQDDAWYCCWTKLTLTTIDSIKGRDVVNWAKGMPLLSHNLLHHLLYGNWICLYCLVHVVRNLLKHIFEFVEFIWFKLLRYMYIVGFFIWLSKYFYIHTVLSLPIKYYGLVLNPVFKWSYDRRKKWKWLKHADTFCTTLLYYFIVPLIHKLLQRSIVEMKVCGYLWWEDN